MTAQLDFPNNPAVNDLWTGPNGAIYEWDGSTWNLSSAVGSGSGTAMWIAVGTTLYPSEPYHNPASTGYDLAIINPAQPANGHYVYFGDPATATPTYLWGTPTGVGMGLADQATRFIVETMAAPNQNYTAAELDIPATTTFDTRIGTQLVCRVHRDYTEFPGILLDLTGTVPNLAGAMKYAAGHFQGYGPSGWVNLDAQAAASLWTDLGTSLTPAPAQHSLTIPGDVDGFVMMYGATSRTMKYRLRSAPAANDAYTGEFTALTANRSGPSSTPDDPTQPSWSVYLAPTNATNVFQVEHTLGGPGETVELLTLFGNGGLTLQGHTNQQAPFKIVSFANSSLAAQLQGLSGRGTVLSPTAVQSGDQIFTILANGYFGSTPTSAASAIQFIAAENWTSIARGTRVVLQTTPLGGTSATSSFTFANNGDFTISGANATKASGTAWINPSDPRLKMNIAPYERGLEDIVALSPITYQLKDDPERQCYGFDAEAVQAIFPECVSTQDDMLMFDMHPILVALINAVKELKDRLP